MKKSFIVLMVIIVGLLLAGCAGEPLEPGTLSGRVTIGPIWPVEPPEGNPPIPCEVYEARKIMVHDKKGSRLIKQVDIDCNGNYSVELSPGVYTIDINRIGIDFSKDLPKKIEIKPGETFTLDIDIDTGIR